MADKGMSVFTAGGEDYLINDPNIADEFSASTDYAAGDYCTYKGKLYRFKNAHSAGAWSASDVAQKSIVDILKLALIGSENSVGLLGVTDADNFEYNRIYLRSSASQELAHVPYTDWVGVIVTLSITGGLIGGSFQLALSKAGDVHIRNAWGDPAVFGSWTAVRMTDRELDAFINKHDGLLGSYTGAFTSSERYITVPVFLQPNTSYTVKFKNTRQGTITVLPTGVSGIYKFLRPFYDEVTITLPDDGTVRYLNLYDYSNAQDSVDLEIYETSKLKNRKYRVCKNIYDGDYTSVTQCLLDLKDDHSPKTVEIWEGDYDIYQEYLDAGVPVYTGIHPDMEFVPYCVFIPENTHVIGKGVVRLMWMPDPSEDSITWMQCYAVSPVNVMASMTLENVEVHCKNGRYCIHNDTIGLAPYAGAVQKFINVKCYKYEGDSDSTTTPGETHIYGTSHCIGYGLTRSQVIEFDNCLINNAWDLGRGFYGHTNIKWNNVDITNSQSGEIILKDCVINTSGENSVYLVNMGSETRKVRTKLADCYISGVVKCTGANVSNSYALTFLDCGDVSLHYDDASNPYAPEAYRTNITTV